MGGVGEGGSRKSSTLYEDDPRPLSLNDNDIARITFTNLVSGPVRDSFVT